MVRTVLSLVLVTNELRQHHFHKQKIYLLRIFPLIQPVFLLRNDYFEQNNLDLQVEMIYCIQAIWREPITTLSAPLMVMSRFIRTNYHAGQIFIPHRLCLRGHCIMTSLRKWPFWTNLPTVTNPVRLGQVSLHTHPHPLTVTT